MKSIALTLHEAIKITTQNNSTQGILFAVEDGLVLYGFKYLKGDAFNDYLEIDNFLRNGVKPPGY